MRVLMQSRYDILTKSGGDTVQLLETKKALEGLGVEVVVDCNSKADLSSFDLVHLFNLDWVRETYRQAQNCLRQKKPYVLSPIHHRLVDIKIWEDHDLYDFKRLVYPVFRSYDTRELLKSLYRTILNPRELPDFISQLPQNVKSAQKFVLKNASYVLPNAQGEAAALKEDISDKFKFAVVPNGISPVFYSSRPHNFTRQYGEFPFVLCVGRIESRKNQLRIIEAVAKLRKTYPDLRLVLVGTYNPHHLEYILRVKHLIKNNSWILHIPQMAYGDIPPVFAAAKSHISASWKETTGLVNLEAALAGCGVVAPNKGYCREYLGEEAEYCDPGDVSSITKAVEASFTHKPSEQFKQLVLRDFTWAKTAEKTLEVYNRVLGREMTDYRRDI